jgi:hypothetical protein
MMNAMEETSDDTSSDYMMNEHAGAASIRLADLPVCTNKEMDVECAIHQLEDMQMPRAGP